MRTIKGLVWVLICVFLGIVSIRECEAASRRSSARPQKEDSWVINLEFKIRLDLALPFLQRKALRTAVTMLRNSPQRKPMPRVLELPVRPVGKIINVFPAMPRADEIEPVAVPVKTAVTVSNASRSPVTRTNLMRGLPCAADFAANLEKRVKSRCARSMPRAESPPVAKKIQRRATQSSKLTHMPRAEDFVGFHSCTDRLSEPHAIDRHSLCSDQPLCWMMCH